MVKKKAQKNQETKTEAQVEVTPIRSKNTVVLKLGHITSEPFNEAFNKLCNLKNLPPKAMFSLRGLKKKLDEENGKFQQVRADLIEEYAVKDADGNKVVNGDSYTIKNPAEFNKKFADLYSIEIEVPEISFGFLTDSGTTLDLTIADLIQLEFIIE